MAEISFRRVTFSQAARYIFIVQCKDQTKRNEICHDWTSAPTFTAPIKFSKLSTLTIKACEATYDRKLTLVGSCQINKQSIMKGQNEGFFEVDTQLQQKIQGKQVTVGRCHITVRLRNSELGSSQASQMQAKNQQYVDDLDQFQMKSDDQEQDQSQKRCQIRFLIHCGFNFYIGSSFSVNVQWCGTNLSSKFVKDRVSPVWADNILIKGNESRRLEVSIIDQKRNKLQSFKIDPKDIRIMFPYHFKCIFREEHVGSIPEIYFSLIREDVPRFSIIEKQVNLFVKPVSDNQQPKQNQFLLIQSSSRDLDFLDFIEIDLKKKLSFDQVNQKVDSNGSTWAMLVPVAKTREVRQKDFAVLKSLMNRHLTIYLLSFSDWKLVFQNGNTKYLDVLESRDEFQGVLKKIYYHNQRYSLKKTVEISNADDQTKRIDSGTVSEEQQWRILSHNYELREKMTRNSQQNIIALKRIIQEKGGQLVKLKKVLSEVKSLNTLLLEKEESALINSGKQGPKVLQGKYNIEDIIATLLQKQSELEQRKIVNDEIRGRMGSLQTYETNLGQLNKSIVSNAHTLHEQQDRIKKMNLMKEIIPKQRQVIGKLEKIFQQREIDKQMNFLLEKENQKFKEIQRKKRDDLQRVYNTVAEQQTKPLSYKLKADAAEQELVRLNAHLVKLQSYQ